MARIFVAIPIPDEVAGQIDRLCRGLPAAQWTQSAHLHLTLRFVGDVDGPTFCEIGEGLMHLRFDPFELRLSGVGHFPPRGGIRQLWVGVDSSLGLVQLKRKVDNVILDAGIAHERRKYTPHVTIARFGNPPPTERLINYLARRTSFRSSPFPVSSFGLFSSHISAGQAEHILEADYDFVRGVMLRD